MFDGFEELPDDFSYIKCNFSGAQLYNTFWNELIHLKGRDGTESEYYTSDITVFNNLRFNTKLKLVSDDQQSYQKFIKSTTKINKRAEELFREKFGEPRSKDVN